MKMRKKVHTNNVPGLVDDPEGLHVFNDHGATPEEFSKALKKKVKELNRVKQKRY